MAGGGKCQWQRLKRVARACSASLEGWALSSEPWQPLEAWRRHEKETGLQEQEEEEEGMWRGFKHG